MSGHNNDGSWFCPHCREWVEGRHVTFTELHEFCGFPVDKEIESNQPRAKARGFVGDALGYAISLLSRFAGRPPTGRAERDTPKAEFTAIKQEPKYVDSRPSKCPICDGTGLVSHPPGIAGDVLTWPGSTITNFQAYTCRICMGKGTISS